MKEHYTEADLLETYYTQPGESMPVMMHLAQCAECSAKYERLERKLREAAVCATDKHEAFWAKQRATIMARVRGNGRRSASPALRFAAATLLGLLVGGTLVYHNEQNRIVEPPVESMPADLWETEELQEFGSVVEWETWIEGEKQL